MGATIPWLVCPWGPPNHLDMEHDDIPWDCKGAIFSNHITAQDFLFCLALGFLEDSVSTVLYNQRFRSCFEVCRDPEHQYGLVHRLDRFTSGRVVALAFGLRSFNRKQCALPFSEV